MAIPRKGSTSDLSRLLGITPNALTKLCARNILRTESHGVFDLPDAVQSYLAYRENLAAAAQGKGGYSKARTEWTQERARKARLEREQLEGRLLWRDEVTATWTSLYAVVKQRLLVIPSKTAPRLVDKTSAAEIAEVIRVELYEALEELANGNGLPRNAQRKPDDEAA
jgi:phage terminase Nu1 subunit (DNA packaging protein)